MHEPKDGTGLVALLLFVFYHPSFSPKMFLDLSAWST
jgi:hypothetical protein